MSKESYKEMYKRHPTYSRAYLRPLGGRWGRRRRRRRRRRRERRRQRRQNPWFGRNL